MTLQGNNAVQLPDHVQAAIDAAKNQLMLTQEETARLSRLNKELTTACASLNIEKNMLEPQVEELRRNVAIEDGKLSDLKSATEKARQELTDIETKKAAEQAKVEEATKAAEGERAKVSAYIEKKQQAEKELSEKEAALNERVSKFEEHKKQVLNTYKLAETI